jgi:hypothetical protein
MKIGSAGTALSSLVIDNAKDWNGNNITNLGNISIAANKAFKTPNLQLYESSVWDFAIRDALDTNYLNIVAGRFTGAGFRALSGSSGEFSTYDGDDAIFPFQARDNTVGLVEVARLQGAADPTFDLLKGRLTGALNCNKFSLASQGILAGDYLALSLDTGRSTTSLTAEKHKSITVPKGGTYRIKFTLQPQVAGEHAYGRIYRNGTAVGTIRDETGAAPVEYSEDVAGWTEGDEIQIYIWSGTAGHLAQVTNFRVYWDYTWTPLNTYDA